MRRRSFLSLVAFLVSISGALSCFSPKPQSGVSSRAPGSLAAGGALARPSANLSAAGKRRALDTFAKLPLYFEANAGQADAAVKFLSRGPGYGLFLDSTGAWFSLKGAQGAPMAFRMHLAGANPAPQISGVDEQAGKTNYFIGNDPREWRTNVPTYRKVEYQRVYPGVDLFYYGNQRQLEYDFVVAPGADLRAIRMSFTGAERVAINAQGDLEVHTGGAEVLYRKPQAYQPEQGSSEGRRTVEGNFVLAGDNEVAFQVGAYDGSQPLVIDPTILFSTFLGGLNDDGAFGVATDSGTNIYVTGGTTTPATATPPFPVTMGASQTTYGGTGAGCTAVPTFQCGDAFVVKIDPSGATLLYATYLGGNDADIAMGIAVDSSGNAYVSGNTKSSNFPLMNQYPSVVSAGQKHAFVSELNPAGSALLYSTLLGGNGQEQAVLLALDASNNVYVVGETSSTNFPTTAGVVQPACNSCALTTPQTDAFVAKLNTTQTGVASLLFGTYLGGSGADGASGVAVDSTGVYIAGSTTSTDLTMVPSPNPIQPGGFAGGGTACATKHSIVCGDGFVAKLNTTGTSLLYLTYLGGSGEDSATEVVVDAQGNAYVSGGTDTNNATATTKFPITAGAYQTTFGGGSAGCTTTGIACGDAFLAKINPAGTALVYSTYIGGSGDELGFGVQVDSGGNAYITGNTNSSDFPVTANAFQGTFGGGSTGATCTNGLICGDAFLVVLDPTGSRALISSYSGSSGDDGAFGLVVDAFGNLVASGSTNSTSFFTGPGTVVQSTYGGGASDAFVEKFTLFTLNACTNTYVGASGGAWGTNTNWSRLNTQGVPVLPDAFDNVCLGNNNVTVSSALPALNQSVTSITATGGTLTISGGSLTIAHAFSTPTSSLNNVNITGGTLGTSFGTTINGTLTMSTGTLTIDPSTLAVTGMTTLSGGTINGSSGSMLSANGGLTITGSITVDTVSLVNNSAGGSMSGGFTIVFLSNGAVFNNPAGATFDVMDSDGIRSGSGASGSINNFGIFTKSIAGATATGIFAPITNNTGGTVSVGAGTLELTGPGSTGTGSYTVASGAFLQLTAQSLQSGHSVSGLGSVIFSGAPSSLMSGTYNVAGTTTFSPAGSMSISLGEMVTLGTSMFNSGTVTFGPGVTFSPLGTASPMTISGGTVTFNTTQTGGVSLSTVNFTIGTVSGSDLITIPGVLNWTGGSFSGGQVKLNGTGTLSGAGTGTITGESLNINGTFTQSGSATLDAENGALINVNASGTYNLQSSGGITTSSTGASLPTLIVLGTFNFKDAPPASGATTIGIDVLVTGAAAVNILTGSLAVQSGYDMCPSAGTTCTAVEVISVGTNFTVARGVAHIGGTTAVNGTLEASGAQVILLSGASVTGPGNIDIDSGSSIAVLTNDVAVAIINIISGGSLSGVGVVGDATISSTVTNSGTVSPGMSPGTLTINGTYIQTATGVLNTVIGGLTPGTQYSQLAVNGNVSLAGTITGTLINGFVPAAGNSIQPVVLSGTITGSFATNTLQAPVGDTWQLTYLPGTSAPGSVTATLAATAAPNFTISAMPSTLTVTAGSGASSTVTVAAQNGFNSNVALSVSGLPTGVTTGFTPSGTITGGAGTATLTISTAASTAPGTYPITITGAGGGLTNTASATLIVTAPPDFTFSATPATQTVTANFGTSFSVMVSPVDGFTGTVTATVSGLPAGATFTPATVSGGSGSAVLGISTTFATPVGTYPLIITGTSGSLSHTASVTLVVTAPKVMLSATSLAFSSTGVGKPSPVVNVTLTNTGNQPLTLDAVSVIAGTGSNPQPGDFTQASGTTCFGDSTVGFTSPNNTCVVNLIFTASGTALETAVLQFVDSATGSPHNVTLTGSIGAPFTLTFTSTNGGPGNVVSVLPGDTAMFTGMLTPTALPVGTIVTLTCPALGTSLPPSTICLLNGQAVLTITVTSTGPITFTVTLQTNCLNGLLAPRAPWNGPGPVGPPASFASLWVVALLLAAGMRRYLPQRWARQVAPVCAALLLVLLVMTWTACVSNPPPALPNQPTTPAGVYPLTVAATVPGISQVTVVLTVHVI